jgi:hypothetical protein
VANDRHKRAERAERRDHHERIADRGEHYGVGRACSADGNASAPEAKAEHRRS